MKKLRTKNVKWPIERGATNSDRASLGPSPVAVQRVTDPCRGQGAVSHSMVHTTCRRWASWVVITCRKIKRSTPIKCSRQSECFRSRREEGDLHFQLRLMRRRKPVTEDFASILVQVSLLPPAMARAHLTSPWPSRHCWRSLGVLGL